MLDEQAREDLIERITAIFSNEAEAAAYGDDPQGYVDEHLPEGTEAADVASCLPEVGERTGLDFSNVAHVAPQATAAAQISHSYTTIYQQNAFIYAEEGSQVANIQGDGNAVAQQDIDVDVDFGEGDEEGEEPVEEPHFETTEGTEQDAAHENLGISVEDLQDPVEPAEESHEDPYDGLDLEFTNTANAGGAPEAPEAPEAPAEAPVDEGMDV
jgi:hypothetical protein